MPEDIAAVVAAAVSNFEKYLQAVVADWAETPGLPRLMVAVAA